ncbi:sensor histidine kinase [Streptomyces sp. ST2-7A]|uniref:sensor histidine kinase n=1 Tax=Streptomyces sp. ST2-7A TaxID=2907214 RepID=UPI001F442786|nr:histidine kinase [Streptomyces sp. ST2-7A]MCE7079158.1 histidine kinase [Streptomyces sp. ST2-7A]
MSTEAPVHRPAGRADRDGRVRRHLGPDRPEPSDAALTAAVALLGAVLALIPGDGAYPDARGWMLLAGATLPLVWRRRYPLGVLTAVVLCVGPYHALGYAHAAAVPASVVAVYTLAVTGPRVRTVLAGAGVVLLGVSIMAAVDTHTGAEMLRVAGWVLVVLVFGEAVRIHHDFVDAVRERAERAERTREEEAARRVAEERVRIARDLHDLLAHGITLIGVQTAVASHLLRNDPERLDREALARSLEGIADTCRDARSELRRTLRVLRADDPPHGAGEGPEEDMPSGPLPDLAGIPDLARSARAAGAVVDLEPAEPADLAADGPVPPVPAAAAYRIAQESLTNAVRHAGPRVRVRVRLERTADALRITTTDDGGDGDAGRAGGDRADRDAEAVASDRTDRPDRAVPPGERSGRHDGDPPAPGFGIAGMRERARSVGGTLEAAHRPDAPGFVVTALLPLRSPVSGPGAAPTAPGPTGAPVGPDGPTTR